MSEIYLIVDTRERAVIPYIKNIFDLSNIKFVVRQISIGDYHICQIVNGIPTILVCFERKTLIDFSQSFKDNRYQNIEHMINLRNQTTCKLFYFIESQVAFPNYNRKFSHIKYSNINSAIVKMIIYHDIHVILTKDKSHTALKLLEFILALIKKRDNPTTIKTTMTLKGRAMVKPSHIVISKIIPKEIINRIKKSDRTILINIWMVLRGISIKTSVFLINKLSVNSLVNIEFDISVIYDWRLTSNRLLGVDALDSLYALNSGDKNFEYKILSGIPFVGMKISKKLLNGISLTNLLKKDMAYISSINISDSKTIRLGPTRACSILKYLNMSFPLEKV